MEPDEVLLAIEERLLKRKLTPAERIVLGQTWNKQTYEQMAKQSGYGDAHLKDTGYKLWRAISQALGQRVTKKSLLFVLREYLQPLSRSSNLAGTVSTLGIDHKTIDQTIVQKSTQQQYPSGPLPPDSLFYIERPPNEDLAYSEIQRPGGFLRIKAPQKMGKTSLVFRLIETAHRHNYQTVHLDLQTVDQTVFSSIDKFLKWFCTRSSKALNLSAKRAK
ncbi:AAA-like domain-containing protein, partial [Leptolyngbya cf. ectocarpi LEGE 11479]